MTDRSMVTDKAQFVLDLRHRTCNQVPVEDCAPEMYLERAEDDMGIYTCPMCHQKVSVLMFFERGTT